MTPPPNSAERALTQRLPEQAKTEVSQDLAALTAFVEAHGSFAEMVREHCATVGGKKARSSRATTKGS
jgi:hypothetical protein